MDIPPPEQIPDAAGVVIVDIGGDRGAAVISTPRELAGAEIEIRAAGTEWDGRTPQCTSGEGPESPRPLPYSGRSGPGATS